MQHIIFTVVMRTVREVSKALVVLPAMNEMKCNALSCASKMSVEQVWDNELMNGYANLCSIYLLKIYSLLSYY